MTKNIFLFDVDDTVCPSAQPIGPGMAGELSRRIQMGQMVGFISGATAAQIRGQMGEALQGEFHVMGTCGAQYELVRGKEVQELYHRQMDPQDRQRIVTALKELATRHGIVTMTSEEDQVQDRLSQVTFSAIGRHAPDAAKRAFDPSKTRRRALALELGKVLGPKFQITVGGTTSLDVTPQGQDKGWGIETFLSFRKLEASAVLFFGDNLAEGGNDYPARRVVDCQAVQNPEDTLEQLKRLSSKGI